MWLKLAEAVLAEGGQMAAKIRKLHRHTVTVEEDQVMSLLALPS